MKVFVTGVAGQLGHDVMNELKKRGYEGIGSILHRNMQECRTEVLLPQCHMFL